jgi:hypothetical protein
MKYDSETLALARALCAWRVRLRRRGLGLVDYMRAIARHEKVVASFRFEVCS